MTSPEKNDLTARFVAALEEANAIAQRTAAAEGARLTREVQERLRRETIAQNARYGRRLR